MAKMMKKMAIDGNSKRRMADSSSDDDDDSVEGEDATNTGGAMEIDQT